MDWTDKIRRVKIVFVLTAILVAISSLFVSKTLTDNLKREEHGRMEVWAEAMKSLSKADGNTDLSLVLKVLNENDYIPVILLDRRGNVTDYRNVRPAWPPAMRWRATSPSTATMTIVPMRSACGCCAPSWR